MSSGFPHKDPVTRGLELLCCQPDLSLGAFLFFTFSQKTSLSKQSSGRCVWNVTMHAMPYDLIWIVWIVYIIFLGTLTSAAYIAAIRENYSSRTPNKLSMTQQIFHRSPTEEAIYGVHCRLNTKPWSTTVAVLFRTLVVYVPILGTDLGTKSRNSQKCLWNMVKFCWAILLRNVLNKYHTINEALIN